MSFKRKILLSYCFIFLVFALLFYPVSHAWIGKIQKREMGVYVHTVAHSLEQASNWTEMVYLLQKGPYLLFDISLEHTYPHMVTKKESLLESPEVRMALDRGVGYAIRNAPDSKQEMMYVAVTFNYNGEIYILEKMYPYAMQRALLNRVSLTFLALGLGTLLLFGMLSWLIVNYLTSPIHEIIQWIKPYQLGYEEKISEIRLSMKSPPREFQDLAATFNSLSNKLESQIHTLVKEKNEKSAVLESLIEGVIAVDQEMNIIYMNRTAEIFLEKRAQDLAGQNFALTGEKAYEELLREAQKKGVPIQSLFKPGPKQKRFLDTIAIPRGKNEGAILVLQDKTSLYKILELGRDFIANASHELKTPITIIRGFAETLHDHPELSSEVYQEITGKIVSNCQRMDTLVRNLLTLAALDEGLPRAQLHESDLIDLVEQARQTVLAVHPGAHISIIPKGEEPFQLVLDSDLFLQAILNLLDNAVKYSKPPAQIKIFIEKRAHEYVLKVVDKGIGIPHEDLDRIFDRFFAVDKSRSRSLGGSGLGLAIVKSILEKVHGRIEVESTLGKGTTFTITLPH